MAALRQRPQVREDFEERDGWAPVNRKTLLHLVGPDAYGEVSIEGQAFGTDIVWNGSRANGTARIPTALRANDYITTWVSGGNDGTTRTPQQGGAASFHASRDWNATDHSTDMRVYIIKPGEIDIFEAARFGGGSGDMLTVNGILSTTDRITATAISAPDTPPAGKSYVYIDETTRSFTSRTILERSEGRRRRQQWIS